MALIFMIWILNPIIENVQDQEIKSNLILLINTLARIVQLLCVRVLSIESLDIVQVLSEQYMLTFEKVFPGCCTPNMVLWINFIESDVFNISTNLILSLFPYSIFVCILENCASNSVRNILFNNVHINFILNHNCCTCFFFHRPGLFILAIFDGYFYCFFNFDV